MIYKHTQFGWVMAGGIGVVVLLLLGLGYPEIGTAVPTLLILGLILLLFYALTVEVDAERLRFWFGIRLVRKCIPLAGIVSCQPVGNPWYCGWGIRWWGRGWLYNVSGFQAVELELATGKRLRIGTDEPEQLARAINQAVAQSG